MSEARSISDFEMRESALREAIRLQLHNADAPTPEVVVTTASTFYDFLKQREAETMAEARPDPRDRS